MDHEEVEKATEKQLGGCTGKGFMPGVSGNPAGKPKGTLSITSEMKKKLQEVPEGKKLSYLEAFIMKMLRNAIDDGDSAAQKLIWNYIDGMPKESKDIRVGELPIPILGNDVLIDASDEEDSAAEEEN